MYHIVYESSDEKMIPESFYVCHPVTPEGHVRSLMYEISLPDDFLARHRMKLKVGQKVTVTISSAYISSKEIVITSDASIDIVENAERKTQRSLKSPATNGTLTALVLRVIALDTQPNYTAPELYNLTFVDSVSFRYQVARCSWGVLFIEPTSYGVLEVPVSITAAGNSHVTLVNEALANAVNLVIENVDDIQEVADLILLVLPPGTDQGWIAYAGVRGQQSIYNDQWGGAIGAVMHEVGHNLGLMHAFYNGVEYEGETGYMGFEPLTTHYPLKCYNGLNHWDLGWYKERSLSIPADSSDIDNSIRLKVAAFVDYNLCEENEVIVVQVADLYLQYNRAKSFNIDTKDFPDALTIDRDMGDAESALLTGLNMSNRVYGVTYGSTPIYVSLCEVVNVEGVGLDYVIVEIGRKEADCVTQTPGAPVVAPVASPSASPVAAPVTSPPISPTFTVLPPSTPWPTNPIATPTLHPAVPNSPFPTNTPHHSPTGPAGSPSVTPPNAVTEAPTRTVHDNFPESSESSQENARESGLKIKLLPSLAGLFCILAGLVIFVVSRRRAELKKLSKETAFKEDSLNTSSRTLLSITDDGSGRWEQWAGIRKEWKDGSEVSSNPEECAPPLSPAMREFPAGTLLGRGEAADQSHSRAPSFGIERQILRLFRASTPAAPSPTEMVVSNNTEPLNTLTVTNAVQQFVDQGATVCSDFLYPEGTNREPSVLPVQFDGDDLELERRGFGEI